MRKMNNNNHNKLFIENYKIAKLLVKKDLIVNL